MAETQVIARMAEKLSDGIFDEFFWRRTGPMNENWECMHQQRHGVKTHPTDAVFFYDDPYSGGRRYIQCDLKSYSKKSIEHSKIKSAIISLSKQVTCAEVSEDWQRKYLVGEYDAAISGLLFVYNHDDEYDADFDNLLRDVRSEDLDLKIGSRVFVFGPDDINWFDRVATEIAQMRGKRELPDKEYCRYFHPQLVRKTNSLGNDARAATLEMLSSPWIVLRYENDERGRDGVVVFHRRPTTVDNLMYLIEYLRHYQLLEKTVDVTIKVPQEDVDATSKLQKATHEYVDKLSGENSNSSIAVALRQIRLRFVPEMKTSFSRDAIGMEYVEQ